jgi:salicylate hydroxylase
MDVVVAGGGIGGLAAGIALADAGVGVTVVERTAVLAAAGSGMVLGPNGVKALDAVSPRLGAAVRAAGYVPAPGDARPWLTTSADVTSTDPIGTFAGRYGAPQVSLLRSALQAALAEEAVAAGVTLHTGATVTGHTDHGDAVEVALADGTTITASALVGADGLNSAVRSRLLADGPPAYCGYTSVRGRCAAPEALPFGYVCGDADVHLFTAPTGRGRLYWAAKLTADRGTWPVRSPEDALAGVLDAIGGWHPALTAPVRESDPTGLVVTDVEDRDPAPVWTRGRVTLLGDAAHPMSPAVGQGASLAVEDAVVLARCLRREPDVPTALADYERIRVPRAAAVVAQSRQGRTVVVRSGADSAANDPFDELYGWQPAA